MSTLPVPLPCRLELATLPSSCRAVMPGMQGVRGRGPGWPATANLTRCLQPLAQAASTGAGRCTGATTSCVSAPRQDSLLSSRADVRSQPCMSLSACRLVMLAMRLSVDPGTSWPPSCSSSRCGLGLPATAASRAVTGRTLLAELNPLAEKDCS